jgi:hypothetical protein
VKEASTVFAYQLQWICAIDGKASLSCRCEYFTVSIKASVEYLDGIGRRDAVSSQVHGGRQVNLPNMEHHDTVISYILPDRILTNKYSTCNYRVHFAHINLVLAHHPPSQQLRHQTMALSEQNFEEGGMYWLV